MVANTWATILGNEKSPAPQVERADFEAVTTELIRHHKRTGLAEMFGAYPKRIRPHSLGMVAAHSVRGHEIDRFLGENKEVAAVLSDPEIAAAVGSAGHHAEPDDRLMAGLRIDRVLRETDDTGPAALLARWLRADAGSRTESAGQLCGWLRRHPDESRWLIWGWWTTYGDVTVTNLAAEASPQGGRPTRDEADRRAALRTAVRWRYSIGDITKPALAAEAGVSRPTLNAWLAGS